jgi:hypothetical protein
VDAFCLIVAGVIRATLPGPDLAVEWQHSVAKTRWEERYRIDDDHLLLTEARVEGSGAGMEPPPESELRDGIWSWHPRRSVDELRLTRSTYTSDYRLCTQRACTTLGDRIGRVDDGTVVIVRPCNAAAER